jgi:DNA polymerase-3 subunit beta
MKIKVNKNLFIRSWGFTEHSAAAAASMNILSTVRLIAGADSVEMQATNIKTSVVCEAQGVEVIEPGEAAIPIKGVSDLFRKIGTDEFMLQIDDGKALMTSGRNKYRFSTYPSSDFPNLPKSSGGSHFCTLNASIFSASLARGTLCTSNDEFPQYLSSAYLELRDGYLNIISTDKRRLAMCRMEVDEAGDGESMLLSIKCVRELQRILEMVEPDTAVKVVSDDAQAYFIAPEVEFAIRKSELSFPDYVRILPKSSSTVVVADKSELASAIERVDIVVRDSSRIVVMNISEGRCVLSGRSQEFGEAVESITCDVEGDRLRAGFNTKFFMDAVKALDGPEANLSFNGPHGHMVVQTNNSDLFLCMVAPVELGMGDVETDSEDSMTEQNGDVF